MTWRTGIMNVPDADEATFKEDSRMDLVIKREIDGIFVYLGCISY